ncbi:hypothetical protein [Kosmotoga sp. DU53]|uniref:hypothetical protein n=1 Tax=Kosmotoga sp. DU53 TaxID=1310160 RepID=UPI0007C4C4AD|nr:hypothetical protein [Kosmotoga sp. DU53]OAA23919.1 hypothetical protein DU53_01490 [Kosmotoga sp. DU53]
MLAIELLLEIFRHILVSAVAMVFAIATVFAFFRFSHKPGFLFRFMNVPAMTFFIALGYILFINDMKLLYAWLFFTGYFFNLRAISEQVLRYDDTFRIFFLSLGYTRQEYLRDLIIYGGRLKILDCVLTFSIIGTAIIMISDKMRILMPDQWLFFLLIFEGIILVLASVRWLAEDFVNKESKSE